MAGGVNESNGVNKPVGDFFVGMSEADAMKLAAKKGKKVAETLQKLLNGDGKVDENELPQLKLYAMDTNADGSLKSQEIFGRRNLANVQNAIAILKEHDPKAAEEFQFRLSHPNNPKGILGGITIDRWTSADNDNIVEHEGFLPPDLSQAALNSVDNKKQGLSDLYRDIKEKFFELGISYLLADQEQQGFNIEG